MKQNGCNFRVRSAAAGVGGVWSSLVGLDAAITAEKYSFDAVQDDEIALGFYHRKTAAHPSAPAKRSSRTGTKKRADASFFSASKSRVLIGRAFEAKRGAFVHSGRVRIGSEPFFK